MYMKELEILTVGYRAFPFKVSLSLQLYNGNNVSVLIEPRFQDERVLE